MMWRFCLHLSIVLGDMLELIFPDERAQQARRDLEAELRGPNRGR